VYFKSRVIYKERKKACMAVVISLNVAVYCLVIGFGAARDAFNATFTLLLVTTFLKYLPRLADFEFNENG